MGRSPIWIKVYAPIWCPSVYRREHLIHVYIAAQMYIIRIRQKRRGYYEMWIHNHFWLLRLFFFPIILKKKNKKNNFRKNFDTYIFRQKTRGDWVHSHVLILTSSNAVNREGQHRHPLPCETQSGVKVKSFPKRNPDACFPLSTFILICEQRFAWKQDYVTTLYFAAKIVVRSFLI